MPELKTIIYPVRDSATTKAVFTALLGSGPVIDEPYYIHFAVGDLEIGLDPNGHSKGMAGPVAYWHVQNIAAVVESLIAAGATVVSPPAAVGGGRQIAVLQDADGNPIGLIQPA